MSSDCRQTPMFKNVFRHKGFLIFFLFDILSFFIDLRLV